MTSNKVEQKDQKEKTNFLKAFITPESLRCILFALILVGITVSISFLLGQLTYMYLETNASNSGHMYSIILSAITFFFFTKYYNKNKNIVQLRAFLILYLVVYFSLVCIILTFLYENVSYFVSTLGNSLILFSVYTLITFLLNPEILGIHGSFRKIFAKGQQVRVILVYLSILLMQVFGFSLLNYAISWFAWYKHLPTAYNLDTPPGTWFDFIYLSFITFVTIGYGDIHPVSNAAKFSAIIQSVLSHIISILFLAILFVYISSSIEESSTDKIHHKNT
ncbi:MAG: potassium channel family protein [Candidatus Helarchaeota archaeon]